MDHLEGLNSQQKEAALHQKGPLLIVAGAGAGKTKTITHRIINLIKQGVPPEKILAVTFTNKAAKEMRERVEKLMNETVENIHERTLGRRDGAGQRNSPAGEFRGEIGNVFYGKPFISTFHSLGVQIIKENARTLGLTKYFTILDEGDSISLVKDAIKEIGLDPKEYEPRRIKGIISREKGNFTELEDYKKREDFMAKIAGEVWELYEKKKAKENSLDFDDLLIKSTKLLKENKEILKIYQTRWEYLHIDEYQDTNEVQYLLSKLLSASHQNICVVGDADQNIYSWRGANLKNILSFEKDYKEATIIFLEENYRSTQNILEAANTIIKKNKFRPEKNLFTKNKVGEKISLYEAIDEGDEADFVATKILELLDTGEKDFAVLYRANFQSRVLEEAMLRYSIPYQVLGVKFFERKEIKDTLAYLRSALNPESLSDIKRIINFPKRGIGKVTLVKIFAKDTKNLPPKMQIKIQNFYQLLTEIALEIKTKKPSAVIQFVVKRSGIEQELKNGSEEDMERLANIKELATLALKYDNLPPPAGIEKLLEEAALSSEQDSLASSENKKGEKNPVKLMTVHAAKGLEFKYVFVVGLEEGLFPNERDGETKSSEEREEERRLFYVALTRAREKLFLSSASYRTIFGSRSINTPSQFIHDIPGDLIETEGEKIKTIYL